MVIFETLQLLQISPKTSGIFSSDSFYLYLLFVAYVTSDSGWYLLLPTANKHLLEHKKNIMIYTVPSNHQSFSNNPAPHPQPWPYV